MLANFFVVALCATASSAAFSTPSSLFARADGDKCTITLKNPPPPMPVVCGRNGALKNPMQVGGVTKTASVENCVARCRRNAQCISLSYNADSRSCRLYSTRVINQTFKQDNTSPVKFWKASCWTCACGSDETNCDGICYNLQSNANNCGQCGATCPTNSMCSEGSCTCNPECTGGQECDSGTCQCPATTPSFCSGQCTNINGGDNANCGACNNPCIPGADCLNVSGNGQCTCKQGTEACPFANDGSPACVNTQTDSQNCGSCGSPCAGDQQCSGGQCVCKMGTQTCPNGGSTCFNLQNDSKNCGSCGRVCPDSQQCNNGNCECSDPRFNCLKVCGGICHNICSENNNCAVCGGTCPAGTHCYFAGCVNND